MDPSESGQIEFIELDESGYIKTFYILDKMGMLMTYNVHSIVPGSIKNIEIIPRLLDPNENRLLHQLQSARQGRQLVSFQMKRELMNNSWGSGRANSVTGFVEKLKMVSDGGWAVIIRNQNNRSIFFKLNEIDITTFRSTNTISNGSDPLRLNR